VEPAISVEHHPLESAAKCRLCGQRNALYRTLKAKWCLNSLCSYNLYVGRYGEHDIVLRLHQPGAAAYAFTFGA
jgi:hypothetical protein